MAWGLMGAPCLSLASHSEDVLSAVLFLCVTFNGGHASLPRAILTQYRSKRTLKPCYAFEPEKNKMLVKLFEEMHWGSGCVLCWAKVYVKFLCEMVGCMLQFGFGGTGTGMRFTLCRSRLLLLPLQRFLKAK